MMNETPEAALRSRIADLEQQLKLADEGTSRLAQRCLELEKQLQTFYAAHPQKERQTDSPALVQPLLYYDAGFGFSQKDTVKAPDYEYDELNGMVTATFELPETAFNLRFDPGELPCCITDFVFSDDRILCRPVNGVPLHGDGILFLNDDPNFMLEGLTRFPAGMELGVTATATSRWSRWLTTHCSPPFSRAYSISRRPASASRSTSTSWKRLRLTRSRPSRPCRRISPSCIRPTPS